MNKKSLVLIISGILLIIIALILVIYNNYVDNRAGTKSQEILNIIESSIDSDENDTIMIDGNIYFGIIEIPAINIKLPIMKEWNYEKLKISPCIYYGSIETNNLVICAHSYKSLFRYIRNLNQGDIVIITDINGNKYLYEVEETETLSPTAIKDMIESEFDLTLYTCTNDNQNRITVRLNMVENSYLK